MAGVVMTGLAALLFVVFTKLGLRYWIANPLAWAACQPIGFLISKTKVFRQARASRPQDLILYVVNSILMLLISTGLYAVTIDAIGMGLAAAVVTTASLCAILSYTIQRQIIFRTEPALGRE
jgi:putative flippase GtrA